MSTDVMSVRLPGDVKERLDKLSAITGRPVAYYVREAVVEHLGDLEWAYGIAAHAEAARSGLIATRPMDDLARELGFDPVELRAEARAEAGSAG